MAEVRIGTCSWKYDSWRGIVYPEKGAFDFLEEYARRFDTVEVDQWFWSLFVGDKAALPKEADVKYYAGAVPDNFRFTVKAPNSISLSHHYQKDKAAPLAVNPHFLSLGLYRDFLGRLEPMAGKVGLVMLQFEYLNRKKVASQAEFLEKLEPFIKGRPQTVPLAIECRNPNFLDEAYFRLLAGHDVHHVFCQGYYMPPVWEIEEKFGELLTDTSVIRLMGSDRKGMELKSNDDWSLIIEPKDDELEKIAAMIGRLRKRRKTVYININNHYEGSAPRTAEKVRALLGVDS
jgi:uncharacterized protein YecE (DUF72 family)